MGLRLSHHDLDPSDLPPDPATACGLVAGTPVMCLRGAVRVEDLRPGDRVVSRDRGAVTLERIDRRRQRFVPVRFSDALTASGSGPATLPAGQSVLVRDWRARLLAGVDRAVLPVGMLVDEEFITRGRVLAGDLFQLRFAAPHVIYAGGLEVAMPGHLT